MIALLMPLLLLQASGGPSCMVADHRIEDLIATKRIALHGHEYCQFRIYQALYDIDGDHTDDFLVVFSVEGAEGNMGEVIQFLAVFASVDHWQPVVREVGRRGIRLVDAIQVAGNGTIQLSTQVYQLSDAMCCPSGKGTLNFKFSHGHLTLARE